MSNLRHSSFPDTKFPQTVAHANPSGGQIQENYGPSKYGLTTPGANMPHESITLANAYREKSQEITEILHTNFEGGNGWWFAFAPLRRSEGLVQTWSVYTWDKHVMEPAPEDTAPRYVTFRSEEHQESLTRFSIGSTMRHDLFGRPEGQVAMDRNLYAMISGGWIAAKIIVGQAVVNSKMHWKEQEQLYGYQHNSILEAMEDEVRLFGALSKDDKGIYKVNAHVLETTKDSGVNYNMVVLNKGACHFLALSGSFETEASRRGQAVMEQRLSLGGKSMINVLPNISIYEDDIHKLSNTSADEVQSFVRVSIIGRYMMADGSDFGEHMDSYPAGKLLSFMHASMDIDAWKEMKITTLIEKSMRFTDDGSLSPAHEVLAEDYQAAIQRTGVTLHHPDYLDPYLWKEGDRFNVIQHWGDMDKHYFTFRQTALHGRHAAAVIRKELTQDELVAMQQLKVEIDRMYNLPDITDANLQAFLFAVAANPENKQADRTSFDSYPSLMLQGDRNGGVLPPTINEDGHMEVRDGVLTNYVWAFYPEHASAAASITLSASDPALKDLAGLFGVGTTQLQIPIGAQAAAIGTGGKPVAYVLAPLEDMVNDTDNDIVDDVATTYFEKNTVNAARNLRREIARILRGAGVAALTQANVAAAMAAATAAGRTVQAEVDAAVGAGAGYQAPRLIKAPKVIPYGTINGVRTLAFMHDSGDTRGYPVTLLETASKGVRALDHMARILKRIYPDCEILSTVYAPYFMRTGLKEEDETTALLSNLWDHVKHPVWVRIPQPTQLGTMSFNAGVLTNANPDMTLPGSPTRVGYDIAKIRAVIVSMGFAVAGGNYQTTDVAARTIATGDLEDAIERLLKSDVIDASLRELLMNDASRDRIFASYRGKIGSAYSDYANEKGLPATGELFAHVILDEMPNPARAITPRGLSQFAYVVNTLLSLAHLASLGSSPVATYDSGLVQDILDDARAFARSARATERENQPETRFIRAVHGVAAGTMEVDEPSMYINTRLSINERAFHDVANRVAAGSLTADAALLTILRPSNPDNNSKPLAAMGVMRGSGAPAKEGTVSLFKQARAFYNARSWDKLIFSNMSLSSGHKIHDVYDQRAEQALPSVVLSNFSKKRKHVPPTMLDDVGGPLYGSTGSSDLSKRIFKKRHLIDRFEYVSEQVTDDVARAAAHMLCLTKVNKQSLLNLVRENLPIPDCCYIFAQPWIRIRTSCGLWAEGGSSTANTFYNYEDVVLQFNGTNKIWTMHYTIWMSTAIYDPTRFMIVDAIKFEGYLGGMDDTINDDASAEVWDPENIDLSSVKSAFVFSCGATFSRELAQKTANPLCLYGKYDIRALPYNFADRARALSATGALWPSFHYYDTIWGLTRINSHNPSPASLTTFQAIRENTYITGMMPMGNHKIYEKKTDDLTKLHRGNGHLDCLAPPMRAVLNGKLEFDNSKTKAISV